VAEQLEKLKLMDAVKEEVNELREKEF